MLKTVTFGSLKPCARLSLEPWLRGSGLFLSITGVETDENGNTVKVHGAGFTLSGDPLEEVKIQRSPLAEYLANLK